jgi:hypothetical protein
MEGFEMNYDTLLARLKSGDVSLADLHDVVGAITQLQARVKELEAKHQICPDCHNHFHQPFRCTTCGAQKLYDHSLKDAQQRAGRAEAALATVTELLKDVHEHQGAHSLGTYLNRRIDAALTNEQP